MNSINAEQLGRASKAESPNYDAIIKCLQFSSSVFAVAGGSLLASNTEASKFGFLMLAFSSGQMLATSLLTHNKNLMLYAGSVFVFVDCLGVYRWLLQ